MMLFAIGIVLVTIGSLSFLGLGLKIGESEEPNTFDTVVSLAVSVFITISGIYLMCQ